MVTTSKELALVTKVTRDLIIGVQSIADNIARDIAEYMKDAGQNEDEAIEMNVDDMMRAVSSLLTDPDLIALTRMALIRKTRECLRTCR